MDLVWIALSLTGHLGIKTLTNLRQHFDGDLYAALTADTETLTAVPGVGPVIARAIQSLDLEQVQTRIRVWQLQGVRILTPADDDYPAQLHTIADPPAALFMRGWPLVGRTVAVVGTRQPSDQAQAIAHRLGYELARRGFVVVSGLAAGIDTAAHQGALEANGGRTAAVLGSGVLHIYPAANLPLAQRIINTPGATLFSETAPDMPPSTPRLVARNRIISGLSDAVIVVETSATGGAMHAARRAIRQGRPLYVVRLPASGNKTLMERGAQAIHPDLSNLDLLYT